MVDRFCGNCGRELRPGNRFCTGCGHPVHGAAGPARGATLEASTLFEAGEVRILEGDRDVLTDAEAQAFLARHTQGDFGDIPEMDRELNFENIEGQFRGGGIAVGSTYPHPSGKVVRVVTYERNAEDAAEFEADLVESGFTRREAHEHATKRESRVFLDDSD